MIVYKKYFEIDGSKIEEVRISEIGQAGLPGWSENLSRPHPVFYIQTWILWELKKYGLLVFFISVLLILQKCEIKSVQCDIFPTKENRFSIQNAVFVHKKGDFR